MAHQYVYTMHRLGKSYGPGQEVLKNISLSFLPGAKIGVLGLNGAGKSTLLRIMAAELGDFTGDAFAADGLSVGYLPQEPRLNPDKTVKGNVEEGAAEHKSLLKRYDAVTASFNEGLTGDELQDAMDEQGRLQDQIEAAGAWDLDSRVEQAMDALRLPPPRSAVTRLSGGRAAPRRPVPADAAGPRICCCSTSRPTISTPRRWRGWSGTCSSTRARWSRSPTTATSSTTSPAGFSSSTAARASRGRATTPRGSTRSSGGSRWSRSRRRGAGAPSPASWSGSACRRAPARRRARRG